MPAETYGQVQLDKLHESPLNNRHIYNETKLEELAASIKSHGIIEPLVARPHPKKPGHYEIIAGSRRFRASKMAGLVAVPVVERNLSDQEALEIIVIENGQRDDNHPLEQAAGFEALLKTEGYSAQKLASRIGHQISFVYKRLALNKLIEPLKGKFLQGEISLAHATLLCRLQEPDQVRAAKDVLFEDEWEWRDGKRVSLGKNAVSPSRLNDWVNRYVLLILSASPWKKDDAELLPEAGACNGCPKRTGAQENLFEEFGKDERCLDGRCYQKKLAGFIDREAESAKKRGETLARVVTGYTSDGVPKGALTHDKFHEATKNCKTTQPAIVVAGSDIGQKLKICTDQKCKGRYGESYSSSRSSTPKRSLADVWKQKERELAWKIDGAVNLAIAERVVTKTTKLGRREMELIAHQLFDPVEPGRLERAHCTGREGWRAADDQRHRGTVRHRDPDAYGADDCVAIARMVGMTVPSLEGADEAIQKAIPILTEAQLAKLIVALLLGNGVLYAGTNRIDVAKHYNLDRKAIAKQVTSKMKLDFKREKDAALAAATPKVKSKPAPKAKKANA